MSKKKNFSEYDVKKGRKNWLREREKRKLSKFCLQRAFIPKALILKNEAIKTFDPLAATVHLRILLQHWLLKKFYCKKINNTRYVYGIKEYHNKLQIFHNSFYICLMRDFTNMQQIQIGMSGYHFFLISGYLDTMDSCISWILGYS